MCRPNKGLDEYPKPYIDKKNVIDWNSSIRAFDLMVTDFKKICEYIDPSDSNIVVYSHRLYEMFIRICTELESNMKAILSANGYIKKNKKKIISKEYWSITDYKKLEKPLKLSEYKVLINIWDNGRGLEIIPFANLAKGKTKKLVWYQDYNDVKHNREDKFHLASLENVIESFCGLFVILFAQFGVQVFNAYQIITEWDEDSSNEIISERFSLFSLKPPMWTEEEKYNFDWDVIKGTPDPFIKFYQKI